MPVAQKLCCTVDQIVDHGNRVYSLILVPERPIPRFLPGQFLHLAVDTYEPGNYWPDSRVFSIASPPENRQSIRITYSVQGKFTSRMEHELHSGSQVWVKLPYGDFIIREMSDIVLMAGGTGITAFTAFLGSLTPAHPGQVHLFYGARTRDLLIYRSFVEDCAHKVPALTPWYFFERGQAQQPNETIGTLSVSEALPKVKNPLLAHYYLSGPPQMLSAFTQALIHNQVPPEQIHVDAWE
jgi:ferredoxin-NADP reductase